MLIKKYLSQIPLCETNFRIGTKTKEGHRKAESFLFIKVVQDDRCGEVLIAETYSLDRVLLKRFFTDGNSWITLEGEEWHQRKPYEWDAYGYYVVNPCYEEENASKITKEFLKKHCDENLYGSAASQIVRFVFGKSSDRRLKYSQNRYRKMMEHIKSVPSPPKGVNQYCDKYVFKNRYIIQGNKKGNYWECKCLTCKGRPFKVDQKLKHKSRVVCPKCGEEAIVIEERYVGSIKDKAKLLILHKVNGHIQKEWNEVIRRYDPKTLKPQYLYDPYYYEIETDSKLYIYHYVTSWCVYDFCSTKYHCEEKTYVYDGNLAEVFENGWHLGMNLKRLKHAGKINFYSLMENARHTPSASQLYKIGLFQMAADPYLLESQIVGDKFESALGVNKVYLPMLRKVNASLWELEALKLSNVFIGEEIFEKLIKLIRLGAHGEIEKMQQILCHMTFIKMVNYFTKQHEISPKRDMYDWFDLYLDYMDMLKQINRTLPKKKRINMTNYSVRFPKDIKTAHDRASKQAELQKNKEKDRAINRIGKALEKTHAFTWNGLTIVVPHGLADFVDEGSKLNHCVGSFSIYSDNHIKGTWEILFIRKVLNPETPFYTLTLYAENNTIKECRGGHNCSMTAEVKQFVDRYCAYLNKNSLKTKSKTA